jgi:hypothetical protein
VIINHNDTYYLVLDNTYSLFTNKLPRITVTKNYITYETLTAYLSVWQLMTGYIPS